MKRISLAALTVLIILALVGCGDHHHDTVVVTPPPITTPIFSDAALDGYIENVIDPATGFFTVTQGMGVNVQSVLAGKDPLSVAEFRAFLDFPLGGVNGVPLNAIIVNATLHIFINNIQTFASTIPIRIDLVSFPQPMVGTDYDVGIQPPLASTTISIFPSDVNNDVLVDVTSLMVEAQRQGLPDFQVRILEDLGAIPGLINIDDTTGADRASFAPLLDVTYQ